jgi:hypothetical protein
VLRGLLVASAVVAGLVCVALAARPLVIPWRRALAFRRLDDAATVDLDGVATASLPPTFHPVGIVNTGRRRWFGGRTTSLEYHLDETRFTFRFEQGQHTTAGGYSADPVLLDVTLFARDVSAAEVARVEHTTIGRFYPPVNDDAPRLSAHFAAQRWLPSDGGTHVAATNEGRGDDVASGPPERWLAIHVDPARRVRVDLYAWRSAYTRDEAVALVRRVAAGLAATPALQAHFDAIATFDARMAARHDRALAAAEEQLAACGVGTLVPGRILEGERCIVRLSENRRALLVVRFLGTAPMAAATFEPHLWPEFPLVEGAPDHRVMTLFWRPARGEWDVSGLQHTMSWDEDPNDPVRAAMIARVGGRDRVGLVRVAEWDLEFHPDAVDVDAFLASAARAEEALRTGTLLRGVPVAP